jgi:hypothetical protein
MVGDYMRLNNDFECPNLLALVKHVCNLWKPIGLTEKGISHKLILTV